MAIATLVLCYDNHNVFLRNVKIPQEETIQVSDVVFFRFLSYFKGFAVPQNP